MLIDPGTLAIFITAVVVLAITPGPDMAMLIARGVGQGTKIASFTALGFTIAGLIQIPLLALGVDTLFKNHPALYNVMLWAGAAYLIWRGIKLLRSASHGGLTLSASSTTATLWSSLQDGMIASLLNPKALIFMVAFLPQFADPARGEIWWQIVVLGIILKSVALLVELTIAFAAGGFGKWLSRHPGLVVWQERMTGLVMIVLGIRLIFSGDTRLQYADNAFLLFPPVRGKLRYTT
jgi:threonine/homoserine/homoserine lactone efflux protein